MQASISCSRAGIDPGDNRRNIRKSQPTVRCQSHAHVMAERSGIFQLAAESATDFVPPPLGQAGPYYDSFCSLVMNSASSFTSCTQHHSDYSYNVADVSPASVTTYSEPPCTNSSCPSRAPMP